jgi:hypothetical protein
MHHTGANRRWIVIDSPGRLSAHTFWHAQRCSQNGHCGVWVNTPVGGILVKNESARVFAHLANYWQLWMAADAVSK